MQTLTRVPNKDAITQFHNVDIDYKATKALAIEKQPIVTEIPLSSIEFGYEKTIKINGKTIPTTDQAYNQLLSNVLSVKPGFVNRYTKATDEKTKLAMLSSLKSGLAAKNGANINVIANKFTQNITGFSSGKRYMNNEVLFDLFERVMNRYGNLGFKDLSVNENGELIMSARTTKETAYLPGEEFLGGLTFRNNPESGTLIGHNAFRLVCTNGMFGFSNISLNLGKGARALDDFFFQLDELSGSNFMADSFEEKMLKKMNSVASVSEVLFARDAMLRNSSIEENALNSFLPLNDVKKYLAKHKIDMEDLTSQKMRNCPSNINTWDLVNIVTDFGSHDYGFDAQFGAIQAQAGHLFSKSCDSDNFVIFYN